MSFIKNIYQLLIALVLAVFYVGCSSSLSGPLFKPVADIPTDKSIIYLYRPNDDKNTEFTITYHGKEICVLENGGYFPLLVKEGKVVISSRANFKLFVTGFLQTAGSTDFIYKAEPGRYYYVKCQAVGSDGNELSMKLVPDNFGINSIKECRLLEPISQ